mmetsp:Transcript_35635/g.83360  ORF Transcript_35635/g.83360 Transcript_35635/m.83360 type:complete len:183 (+) Transcript_35635:112-660(+)
MFFVLELFQHLHVEPKYLGPGYHAHIDDLLRQKVEGTMLEKAGMIIAIQSSEALDSGKLQEGTGLILVPMKYRALVMQAFKNEVVDCEVMEVNKLGFFASVGPLRVFVSKSAMPKGWDYTEDQVGVRGGGPAFLSPDRESLIQRERAVRVRLINVKQDGDKMLAIGSIDGEFLGPLSMPVAG